MGVKIIPVYFNFPPPQKSWGLKTDVPMQKVFMGKIDNEILSEISKNVAMATNFQYLVPLKYHKQSKLLY